MGWPYRLVLVRHANFQGNNLDAEGRARLDKATHLQSLTGRGRQEAASTGEWLRQMFGQDAPTAFDAFYVSTYLRTQETLGLIYPDARPIQDSRLNEANRGIYHFMPQKERRKRYPEEQHRKDYEGLFHYRPPAGESWMDVELRIHSFLMTLQLQHAGKKVLVVGHSHWLLLLERILQGFSWQEAVERYERGVTMDGKGLMPNASVSWYAPAESGHSLYACHLHATPWKDEPWATAEHTEAG